MNWEWFLIFYLLIGMLLSEGLIYDGKNRRREVTGGEYVFVLLLGPLIIGPWLVWQAIKKRQN